MITFSTEYGPRGRERSRHFPRFARRSLGSLLTARLGREILTLSAIGLRSRCGRWPGVRHALLVF